MFVVLIRPLDVGGRSQSECNMQNIKPHGMPLFPASPEKITLKYRISGLDMCDIWALAIEKLSKS